MPFTGQTRILSIIVKRCVNNEQGTVVLKLMTIGSRLLGLNITLKHLEHLPAEILKFGTTVSRYAKVRVVSRLVTDDRVVSFVVAKHRVYYNNPE